MLTVFRFMKIMHSILPKYIIFKMFFKFLSFKKVTTLSPNKTLQWHSKQFAAYDFTVFAIN